MLLQRITNSTAIANAIRLTKKLALSTPFKSLTGLLPRRFATIGIDLGTTNSCIAHVKDGAPKVLLVDGRRTMPSVVHVGSTITVGTDALKKASTDPSRTLRATKRLIGRTFAEAPSDLPFLAESTSCGKLALRVDGRRITPTEVATHVLRKLKKAAETALNEPVTRAVVAVPAYFDDKQRTETIKACASAGLEVIRVINEPTAASLCYGLDKAGDRIVAVYDLGGGTFDVSLLRVSNGVFEVLSTNGDTRLGGEDFDALWTKKIEDEWSAKGAPLTEVERAHLRKEAENAKISISNSDSTVVSLRASGRLHERTISRREYEDAVLPLVERTLEPCRKALKDAKLKPSDVTDVVLVGGMTRMPLVAKSVATFFGRAPHSDVDPDEAVAVGAALQASVLEGERSDLLLLDVNPLSLGIETAGGLFSRLVHRNTTLPVRSTEVFTTSADNQTAVEVNVYQGERKLAKENRFLGTFVLDGLPPMPKGSVRVEVSFDIDGNGVVHVRAKDLATGKEKRLRCDFASGLTKSSVEDSVKRAKEREKEDEEAVEKIELEELLKTKKEGSAFLGESRTMRELRNEAQRLGLKLGCS